jgi:hypothetical protein
MKNRIVDYLPDSWFKRTLGDGAAGPLLPANVKAWAEPIEQFVVKHPGPSLAIAFAAGVTLAWWLKRR